MEGRRVALLIATDTHQDPTFRRLRAPHEDAEALAEVLRDRTIGDYEVRPEMHNAASHNVIRAVEELFAGARPDDQLILYISGHGVTDDNGDLYLITNNSERNLLGSTTLPARFIREQMDRSRSRRKVVLLDCCYGGAILRGMQPRAGQGADVLKRLAGRGSAVVTAATALGYAFELDGDAVTATEEALRPSVFTGALVSGLRTGAADRDGDGYIDIGELYEYTYDQVQAVAPQQRPEIRSDLEGKLYIAKSRHGPRLPADINQAIVSSLPSIRRAIISDLSDIVVGDSALTKAARAALTRLTEDKDHTVADEAHDALQKLAMPPVQHDQTPPKPIFHTPSAPRAAATDNVRTSAVADRNAGPPEAKPDDEDKHAASYSGYDQVVPRPSPTHGRTGAIPISRSTRHGRGHAINWSRFFSLLLLLLLLSLISIILYKSVEYYISVP